MILNEEYAEGVPALFPRTSGKYKEIVRNWKCPVRGKAEVRSHALLLAGQYLK